MFKFRFTFRLILRGAILNDWNERRKGEKAKCIKSNEMMVIKSRTMQNEVVMWLNYYWKCDRGPGETSPSIIWFCLVVCSSHSANKDKYVRRQRHQEKTYGTVRLMCNGTAKYIFMAAENIWWTRRPVNVTRLAIELMWLHLQRDCSVCLALVLRWLTIPTSMQWRFPFHFTFPN